MVESSLFSRCKIMAPLIYRPPQSLLLQHGVDDRIILISDIERQVASRLLSGTVSVAEILEWVVARNVLEGPVFVSGRFDCFKVVKSAPRPQS